MRTKAVYCRLDKIGMEWDKHVFSFTSDASDKDACFLIRFSGIGKLWIDHPSLMPADNLRGWRKDVVELVKS